MSAKCGSSFQMARSKNIFELRSEVPFACVLKPFTLVRWEVLLRFGNLCVGLFLALQVRVVETGF